jgi:ATP-binding cassette subfamily B protein
MPRFTSFRNWYLADIEPRRKILRLLPSAGWPLIASLLALNVSLGALPVAFLLVTSRLIANVPDAVQAGTDTEAFDRLLRTFLLASGLFLARQALAPAQVVLGERMKHEIDGVLRDRTLQTSLKSVSLAPIEDPGAASALSELRGLFDAAHTPGMACSGLLALVARYVQLAGLICIVAWVCSWTAALGLGLVVMMFRHGQRGGLRRYSGVWKSVRSIQHRMEYLKELTTGPTAAKEARVFGLLDWFKARYAETFRSMYDRLDADRRRVYLGPYLAYTAIGLSVASLVMVQLGRSAALGQTSLFGLALGAQAIIAAILLGEHYPESDVPTQFGMRALEALDDVQQRLHAWQPDESRAPRVIVEAALPVRSLSFENVSFTYHGGARPVFDGLDLELPVGKCTAIVGVNGAGKTTLVKLLTRLYTPTSGSIRADGIDISQLEPNLWRRQLSVVFQDFVRYELSAADNISLGAAHVAPKQASIRSAASQAGILETLDKLPRGLDTVLSRAYEGGTDLSGGEWQRIAIARALYALRAGARILVLDEPTSALDVRAEAHFFDQFVELTRGVTSVLISHRFSTVRKADYIVVIEQGRVIERGSHEQLMSLEAFYARLFRLQADRFQLGGGATRESQEPDAASRESGRRAS